MSTFSVSGLTTGVNWRNVIDQLIQIERRPINLMEQRKSTLSDQKTAWSDLKAKLTTVDSKLDALKLDSTWKTKKAISSDETRVTATASSGAVAGTYSITITDLASAHKVGSDKKTGYTVPVGMGGDIQITVTDSGGNPTTTSVSIAEGDTLATIRDNINNAVAGVTATIVDDHLVITRDETGAYGTISFTDNAGGVLKDLGILTASNTIKNELAPAQDASFTVDGMTVTRSTNLVTDVIPNVTLNLKDKTTTAVTVEVKLDSQVIVDKIKAFVEAYNAAINVINTQGGKEGKLRGDGTLLRIGTTMRRDTSDQVAGITTAYKSLSDLGITTDRSGKLVIDETKLQEKVEADPDAARNLFFSDEAGVTGVGEKLDSNINLWTRSYDGSISAREDSLNKTIDDITGQVEALERRIALREQALIRQFTEMEKIVTVFQSQGSWLNSQARTMGLI